MDDCQIPRELRVPRFCRFHVFVVHDIKGHFNLVTNKFFLKTKLIIVFCMAVLSFFTRHLILKLCMYFFCVTKMCRYIHF